MEHWQRRRVPWHCHGQKWQHWHLWKFGVNPSSLNCDVKILLMLLFYYSCACLYLMTEFYAKIYEETFVNLLWIRCFWSPCVLTPDSDQETQWVVSSLETSTTYLGIKISLQKTMLSIIKRTNRFCTNRSRLPLFSKRFIHAGASVYIHWPYCSKLCSYCNFNKYVKDKVDQTR